MKQTERKHDSVSLEEFRNCMDAMPTRYVAELAESELDVSDLQQENDNAETWQNISNERHDSEKKMHSLMRIFVGLGGIAAAVVLIFGIGVLVRSSKPQVANEPNETTIPAESTISSTESTSVSSETTTMIINTQTTRITNPATGGKPMPDYKGMDFESVQDALRSESYSVESISYYSDDYPEGTVVQTIPAAGDFVPIGTKVLVYVSASTNGGAKESVPNFVGLQWEEAVEVAKLYEINLIKENKRSDEVPGTILSQKLILDTKVVAGESCLVKVAVGPFDGQYDEVMKNLDEEQVIHFPCEPYTEVPADETWDVDAEKTGTAERKECFPFLPDSAGD